MFWIFKKKEEPAVIATPACPKELHLSMDERALAVKYGLTFEQFRELKLEMRAAKKVGRPIGAKTRKRRSPKKKAQTNV